MATGGELVSVLDLRVGIFQEEEPDPRVRVDGGHVAPDDSQFLTELEERPQDHAFARHAAGVAYARYPGRGLPGSRNPDQLLGYRPRSK